MGLGNMRLLDSQVDNINGIVHKYADCDSLVYLFGSRVDNEARGGDVDLFIETATVVPRIKRARLKIEIESAIGLPVDLIVKLEGKAPTPFEKIVIKQAIPLVKEHKT